MGGWAIAQSPILGTTITLDRLKNRGYLSLLDIYIKISPQFNPDEYRDCLRDPYDQWCERLSPSVFTDGAVYSIELNPFGITLFKYTPKFYIETFTFLLIKSKCHEKEN